MIRLYKRDAKGKPLVWEGYKKDNKIIIQYGLVGKTLHKEEINITSKKVDELESRIKAKRKEGYKELSELKDNNYLPNEEWLNKNQLMFYLETYLPKNNTTSEGFVLPMLAKVLEDNKPFEKYGTFLGQWKINGLRCIIGATNQSGDIFNPICLTYHSRTGEDWTRKMNWMDEIILPKLNSDLLDIMIEEGAYLDGELYLPGYTVNDINSFVKNAAMPQHYLLQYWCYDICCENMSAEQRFNFISDNINVGDINFNTKEQHLNQKRQFVKLPTFFVDDITSAMNMRDNFINIGFEGLILRNPSNEYQFGKRNQSMFKFKKVDDGIFEIIDIKEDKRGLPIYVLKNDINDELFECTINLSQKAQREQLTIKNMLIGHKGLVEFRERSGVKQVPFHAKLIKIYV